MNIASATAWSAFTAATALSSMARASWGELPCCANAAVEGARADTAPIISVRNIGILSFAWPECHQHGKPPIGTGSIHVRTQDRAVPHRHIGFLFQEHFILPAHGLKPPIR